MLDPKQLEVPETLDNYVHLKCQNQLRPRSPTKYLLGSAKVSFIFFQNYIWYLFIWHHPFYYLVKTDSL